MIDECGADGVMRIGKDSKLFREYPPPVPLCPTPNPTSPDRVKNSGRHGVYVSSCLFMSYNIYFCKIYSAPQVSVTAWPSTGENPMKLYKNCKTAKPLNSAGVNLCDKCFK
jgi:hypothetical protein